MYPINHHSDFLSFLQGQPQARANIRGSANHPSIRGTVRFYQTPQGVLVSARISGLPNPSGSCSSPAFGFHIHAGGSCSGNAADPFADTGMHYNPHDCPHPYHAGDLPPLFGADGEAFSVFLTNRFTVDEILGKTVIIHASPDDFMTQPAGNSGMKMACGRIAQYASAIRM